MPKYEVVGYETIRKTLIVEAKDKQEALAKADMVNSWAWDTDFDFWNFEIDGVEEVKEDE